MTMMTKLKTGVPGFDVLSHGGIPVGRSTLVVGRSGTGKTIFGLQTAANLARNGIKSIILGIEESADDLLATGDTLGFNLSGLFADGRIHVAEMMRPLEDLLVDLRLGLEEYQPSLVVMDSISSIEHASSEKGFRQFMIGVASILRGHGRSALLTQTVLAGASADHTAPYLSTIAGAILSLDYTPNAYDMNRTMRVIKMWGSAHATHPYRLQIGAGGLHIERWTAKGHQASAEAEERWTGARS